jgi:hypothetical protein
MRLNYNKDIPQIFEFKSKQKLTMYINFHKVVHIAKVTYSLQCLIKNKQILMQEFYIKNLLEI